MIGDQIPAQTVVTNRTERRKNPRTPVRRLAYVNLEPYDNGGVITEISSGGLRFHAVNTVEQGGLIRLSVVLPGVNQLQIMGELIWIDESRKVGGIRFTVLPDGAADQILQWAEAANSADTFKPGTAQRIDASPKPPATAQPEVPVSPTRGSETPIPNLKGSSPAEPSQTGPEPKTRTAWVPPPARPPAGNSVAQMRSPAQAWANPGASEQTAISPGMPPTMPWITYFDPDPPARESSFLRGVLGGFILFALLGAGAWFALRHDGWQHGLLRFSLPFASSPARTGPLASQPDLPPAPSAEVAEPLGGTDLAAASPPASAEKYPSASPALPSPATSDAGLSSPNAKLDMGAQAPPGSIPEPTPASGPAGSSSLRSPSPQTPTAATAPKTLSAEKGSPALAPQPVAKAPASLPPRASDTGESQLMLARQYLEGRVQPRNPTVASQLLWSAVEKGNSAAETELADLYLHGDGVARNCDQARVLLSVASEKGNPQAVQKLRELNQTGCR